MQTFLPYPDLRASCVVLDDRRLGKQRVETFQVLRALTWPSYAWKNHPAVRMWRGFVPGLVLYGVESCREWVRRGYADSVAGQLLGWTGGHVPVDPPLPPWFGLDALHRSHRSSLLRKDPEHYRPLFGDDEPDDLPYLWPPDVFPRWPVRAAGRKLSLQDALDLLGLDEPRAGQAEAVRAVAAGRDALLVAAPGTGGSTAGLLAALVTPGRSLWVAPGPGPQAPPAPALTLPGTRVVAPGSGRPPATARAPQAEDLAAMAAETAEPEVLFVRPGAVPAVDVGVVVVDRAGALTSAEGAQLRAVRRAPLLAIVPRADPTERRALAGVLGLDAPVHTGGGWDPATSRLEVVRAATAPARRRVLTDSVRRLGPGLVVVRDRERADSAVVGLRADGLRAAVWAPAPMRAGRAAEAVAAWRQRRLDALVVPAGALPPLGRGRLRLLLGGAVTDPEAWRDLVARLAPETAVLLLEPGAPATVEALGAPGCRRVALLEAYGEPVRVPCGRCDGCAEAGAGATVGGLR